MKSFALAGVGRMGEWVAEEFLKLKASGAISNVTILTRSSISGNATHEKLAKSGAQVTAVDYDVHDSLVSILTGVDAVVSTVPDRGHVVDHKLADAAKATGVKLFLPSEWGLYSKGVREGFYIAHDSIHKHLDKIGLPYTLVYTGMWSDSIFTPAFGWDVPAGKVTIVGEGNTPITWTTRRDAARFLAHILTTLQAERLAGKVISIEGDRKVRLSISAAENSRLRSEPQQTLNELVEAYTFRTGKKLEVTYTSLADQEKILRENSLHSYQAVLAWLLLAWERGAADLATSPDGLSNNLWPDWNPKSAVDAMIETHP
ncbi:NAD-P-binding protein [Neolentinus lepideus HHB14362 ss-1]|uniref:NAD-P-binding protein n=1 Tax=Neolentinus lepideus HHB14362 ss-1 TaxID=1314782 RepID=A0A165SQD9_9AGAM|nr:NAD-P-binding protein [Neolentinus lepideus HHB14362 ss-1]